MKRYQTTHACLTKVLLSMSDGRCRESWITISTNVAATGVPFCQIRTAHPLCSSIRTYTKRRSCSCGTSTVTGFDTYGWIHTPPIALNGRNVCLISQADRHASRCHFSCSDFMIESCPLAASPDLDGVQCPYWAGRLGNEYPDYTDCILVSADADV